MLSYGGQILPRSPWILTPTLVKAGSSLISFHSPPTITTPTGQVMHSNFYFDFNFIINSNKIRLKLSIPTAQNWNFHSESVDASPGRLPSSNNNSWSQSRTSFDDKQPETGGGLDESRGSKYLTKSRRTYSNKYSNYDVQSKFLKGRFWVYLYEY